MIAAKAYDRIKFFSDIKIGQRFSDTKTGLEYQKINNQTGIQVEQRDRRPGTDRIGSTLLINGNTLVYCDY